MFTSTKWLKTICVIKFLLQGKKEFYWLLFYFIKNQHTMTKKLEIEELLPIDRWCNIEEMFPLNAGFINIKQIEIPVSKLFQLINYVKCLKKLFWAPCINYIKSEIMIQGEIK